MLASCVVRASAGPRSVLAYLPWLARASSAACYIEAVPAAHDGTDGEAMMTQPTGTGSGGLTDNIVSAICYVIGPFAAIFLFIAPYSTNTAVRFHAFQSLFPFIGLLAVNIVLSTLASSMFYVMGVGVFLALIMSFYWLAVLAFYVVLSIRATRGRASSCPSSVSSRGRWSQPPVRPVPVRPRASGIVLQFLYVSTTRA